MKMNKKLFLFLLLPCLIFNISSAKNNKSIKIAIWQNKTNLFKFQNNEFEVSLNSTTYKLNPVKLNKQKEIIFEPDSYVEILEIIEINENKYIFCFSALGFEQIFIYDIKNDSITEPFFDLKNEVSIIKKDLDHLVLFGDSWNSDKDIMPDQTVSLYLFSTAKQQHYKIAEKKGEMFSIKILDDYKIEYTDQNGKLIQFDYSYWILQEISYSASSYLIERNATYWPENLSTEAGLPWASANGYGINDTIKIITPAKKGLQLALYNGYQSTERPDLYTANSRVKKIRIKNCRNDKTKDVILQDTTDEQIIFLNELNINTNSYITLEITILEVYQGEKYEDLCIQAIIPIL